jgi:hypothetical protein
MPRPRKVAYEKFAQFVASGLSLAESYRRTTGQTKNADVKRDQWHRYAGIKERIAELKAQNARKSELSREEALQWLSDLIRTPIGSVGKDSPLVQAYEEDSEGKVKVRLADKIAGMQTLSKMTGWFEPERVRVSGDNSLNAYLLALRAQPIGGDVIELERPVLPLKNGNGEESRG